MSPCATQIETGANPFDLILRDSNSDAAKIQGIYHAHRYTRNSQQKALILNPSFSGWSLDSILVRLEGPARDPNYKDPRHNAIIWARPPLSVQSLIGKIQKDLHNSAQNLWIMPREKLHMTALEIATSLTEEGVEELLIPLQPSLPRIANYTYTHRARLIKPLITYDQGGLALSFLPAAGEGLANSTRTAKDDQYTYHHLRRDVHQMTVDTGTPIRSRYVVPSAHVTIARFLTNDDFVFVGEKHGQIDPKKVERFINKIESLNRWLQDEYWPKGPNDSIKTGGEWLVGEENGLDCQKGPVWYGHNHRIMIGRGF